MRIHVHRPASQGSARLARPGVATPYYLQRTMEPPPKGQVAMDPVVLGPGGIDRKHKHKSQAGRRTHSHARRTRGKGPGVTHAARPGYRYPLRMTLRRAAAINVCVSAAVGTPLTPPGMDDGDEGGGALVVVGGGGWPKGGMVGGGGGVCCTGDRELRGARHQRSLLQGSSSSSIVGASTGHLLRARRALRELHRWQEGKWRGRSEPSDAPRAAGR